MFRPVAFRVCSASQAVAPRLRTQVSRFARLPTAPQPLWRAPPLRNGCQRACSSSGSEAGASGGASTAGADAAAVLKARLAKALGVLQVSMMGVAGWEFFSTRALQDSTEEAVRVMDKAGSAEEASAQQLATVRATRDGVMRGFLTTTAAAAAVAALSVGSIAIAVVAGEGLVGLLNVTIFGVYSWHGWESMTEFQKWVKSQGEREDAMSRGMAEFRGMMESRRAQVAPQAQAAAQAKTEAAAAETA